MIADHDPVRRRSTEQYSATVALLGDGVALLDASGTVVSLNPAGERLLGVRASMILGKRLLDVPWDIVNEDGSPRPREEHPAIVALRTGEPQSDVRVGLRRPQGDVAWIDVTAVPLDLETERAPSGVVVSFRDVSRRRAIEAELEESERRLDLIFNATNDFIFLIGVRYDDAGEPTFSFEAVNAAYCELTGRTVESLVGKTLDEALPADRAANARAVMMQTMEHGEANYRGATEFPRGVVISDVLIRVIDVRDGRPSRLLGVGRDVTRQAKADDELRASEERFRTIAESMTDGVAITDLADCALYVNDRVVAMSGYSRDELIGHNLGKTILTAEGRDEVMRHTAGRVQGSSDRYQVEMIRKDGVRRWVEIGGAPYRGADGTVIGTVGVMTDVTERRSIEELRSQMVGVVSHELRTPLTALTGALKLLKREAPPDDVKTNNLVDLATRSAERLLRLVNDLLDLERLEAGVDLQLTTVRAGSVIEHAVEMLAPLAGDNGVTLVSGKSDETVRADVERITQVLINLIGNAIKFSPAGGTVTIGTSCAGDMVELFVRDEGRGIPADRLDTLFKRFAQVHADDARRMKGAGLGLAISRTIVEQHGGKIWATNAEAGGAVFHFTLPRVAS